VEDPTLPEVERQSMEVDIACAGFGPATGGFLTTLAKAWAADPTDPAFESRVAPGMPLQLLCYERADDIAAAVSGVVTRARGIRTTFPDLDPTQIPMATRIHSERTMYLMDPAGHSRRSLTLKLADKLLGTFGGLLGVKDHAFTLPYTPEFLNKHDGLILSIGQFNQWVGNELMATGFAQIWPGTPVAAPLIEELDGQKCVAGLRLADQGVEKDGSPNECFMPGMDVRAALTVVGDGPVGAVGQALDDALGMPAGHGHHEWALGMKFVIELPADSTLAEGTVWHSFGYPEPEIFGFLYVHPDRICSVGIFVPSWMPDPSRTAYRYLQHYIQHPAIWPHVKGGTLRSWGAKSLEESGRKGEPFLSGHGFARIGEGSGSTNTLTNSGVDEAWTTGTQLGEAVLEILRAKLPFTRETLAATYEKRRRASWIEQGSREAENARTGFHGGLVKGMVTMALAGLTHGKLSFGGKIPHAYEQIKQYPSDLPKARIDQLAAEAAAGGRPLHDALLSERGWPEIDFDGQLLVTQQDALLMGGKVQAMPGFADHVRFRDDELCRACGHKTCVAMCSGQAITHGPDGVPLFEREKCVHCGACMWNCSATPDHAHTNVCFTAGSGGLHSAEN